MAMMRSRISFFIFCRGCKFLTGYEVIQGHIKELGHLDKDFNTGCAAALFVHADCARTDFEFCRQLRLAHSGFFSKRGDLFRQHFYPPLCMIRITQRQRNNLENGVEE